MSIFLGQVLGRYCVCRMERFLLSGSTLISLLCINGDLLLIQAISSQFLLFLHVLAKVFEKIVSDQLSLYFEDNHLLHQHHSAYHSGKSTQDILLFAVR